jgi:replicative DNA helicase Mcm
MHDISILKSRFDEFLDQYYRTQIGDMLTSFPDKRSLRVDMRDLEEFDPDMAAEMIDKPDIMLAAANESLRDRFSDIDISIYEPHVRIFGQHLNTPFVQDVGSAYIGKMITLDSLIVKRTEIIPRVRIGVYECAFCNERVTIRVDRDNRPEVCQACKRRSMKAVEEESKFTNIQKIAVQDPLEKLHGSTPTWQLEVWLHDDLVNTVIPGDRVEITGILRIRPKMNRKAKDDTLYAMFLDTVSTVSKQKEFAEIEMTDEEERNIVELSKDPNIFNKIARSIAPSVYGYDEIKQAVALQLFGGTPGKVLVDGGLIRSDMHILLIGDPGSAKTRILQSVSRLVPKGIYVSGKSVTGGGLTAVAERDEFSEGGWTLKAGAMVLGSGGVVAIDEFDKIGDDDRASLHEALESQTISVAKAGIVATFNAKAAVIAAANPKFGRFDKNMYPSEQFDIPATLLSRFDLIFPIVDSMDQEQDRNIAKHILIQHEAAGAILAQVQDVVQVELPPLNGDLLRKYIAYSRKNVRPRLTDESANIIQDYYIELRKEGAKLGSIAITPRQIEGIIRMAEASAKTRMAEVVEKSDAQLAISLNEYMLKTITTDREGRRDIDTILTGMPREKITRINSIINIIKRLEGEEGTAKLRRVMEEAEKSGIDAQTVSRLISELEKSGDIFTPKPGEVKSVRHDTD